jgi:hypothetical protein
MLGGLFQVYRWVITNLDGDWFFYYHCEVLCSSWFLKELFELIKLILWRSNNQTYHLDSREILRFLGVAFQSFVVLVFIWLGDGSRLNNSCLHDLGVPYHHCYRVSSPLLVEFISFWYQSFGSKISFVYLLFFIQFSVPCCVKKKENKKKKKKKKRRRKCRIPV